MRISVFGRSLLSIGPDDPHPLTAERLVREARTADDDGLAGYWVPQQFDIDAMTAVAYLAQHVRRIELGVGVLPLYERHPVLAAQQTLTAQLVTGGRFTLGLGLGHRFVVEEFWGGRFERPVPTLREYLAVVLSLVRTGRVEFQGEFYRCVGGLARLEPRPATPVILGAHGPRMLHLAGQVADGTITWMCGRRTLRTHIVPEITTAALRAGRRPPRIIATLPVCVTDDEDAVRRRVDHEMRDYTAIPSYAAMFRREGVEGPGGTGIIGTAGQVRSGIAALADIGVTELAAVPCARSESERERTREALRVAAQSLRPSPPTPEPLAPRV